MNRLQRLGLVALIVFVAVGFDQLTKKLATQALASSPPISLLNNTIRLEYSENPGAILGVGANLPGAVRLGLFALFVAGVVLLTLVFTFTSRSLGFGPLAGLALISAGGVGNLLDRLFNHGTAIDFMNLGLGRLRTGIFNVADLAIFGGILIFLLFSAKSKAPAAAPKTPPAPGADDQL